MRYGKSIAMIHNLRLQLEKGNKVAVVGCKDPKPILDQLKELGLEASAQPMMATDSIRSIIALDGFEEKVIGFTGGDKKQTGFTFSKSDTTVSTTGGKTK